MAITAYKVLKSSIENLEDQVNEAITEGWQPYGNPLSKSPQSYIVFQVLIKGVPDGGGGGGGPVTITIADISDAGDTGKNVLATSSAADARSAIGAGTSSLQLGTGASQAAAGNHTHAVATTSANGLLSSADKTKLDSVAQGATANSTDAQLRDRATHTGVQAVSTITGLQATLDDLGTRVAALEGAGG